MSKRPSIIAGLTAPPTAAPPAEAAPPPTAEPIAAAPPTVGRRPNPEVVHTSLYVPKAAHRRLKEIALTRDVKVHDLIVEGINAVLEKHGHAAIEPRRGNRVG